MVVHIEPSLLRNGYSESDALLAIRRAYESSDEDLSFGQLVEGLEGTPSLDVILQASRYGDDLGFSSEEARTEIQGALSKLDEFRRTAELDAIRGRGMKSKEDQADFLGKVMTLKRLQGALRAENHEQAKAP